MGANVPSQSPILPSHKCFVLGYSRWMSAGELRDDSLRDKPKVGYATGYYGLTNTFTGYAGPEYTDSDFTPHCWVLP